MHGTARALGPVALGPVAAGPVAAGWVAAGWVAVGWVAVGVVALLLAVGCEARPRARPRAPAAAADKAALFGDPSLVPTREGERARREVALAQEIERALAVLPAVLGARANVELPSPGIAGPPRVLAVVLAAPDADAPAVTAQARAIAHAVVGPAAVLEVVVEPSPAVAASPTPRTPWPLLLGMLGLGLCIGTLVERARRLRRARPGR